MASVTKRNQEQAKQAAADDQASDSSTTSDAAPQQEPVKASGKAIEYARPGTAGGGRGFFAIYKKGQGYWTRMGTLIGAGLLGVLLAYTLYSMIPPTFYLNEPARGRRVGSIVAACFLVIYSAVALYLMNKPSNVDFLIATDSEMKKVNWTSRRELIGSTKIVIIFMLLIALFLFVNDLIFGYLMYFINVLKFSPFHQ